MKKYLFTSFLFALFLFGSNSSFASHIVGGDIRVQYTGTPNYFNITMNFFWDCNGAASNDDPLDIGVFDKVTNALVYTITVGTSYGTPPVTTTLSLGSGCYTPSICIKKSVYYQPNFYIADNPNGYYLAYLRCCRNAAIANIVTPTSEGFVAYTEMPNPALHDNTPYFNTNPDGYMCLGVQNQDGGFTATDPDGDVLVYSFSTPLDCTPSGQCSNSGFGSGYGTPFPVPNPELMATSHGQAPIPQVVRWEEYFLLIHLQD